MKIFNKDYRFYIQSAFALLCVWIGIEMYLFVSYLESGGIYPEISRPPGVDGFLPISSLMSIIYLIRTGIIHYAHPAGIFIFSAIVLVSLVFGKSFCSWLCPVGFISEMLGNIGDKLFGRRLKIPKILDYPLRSIKYLLLGFFLYAIFNMNALALKSFLDSPYNQVADVKMYYFFAEISQLSLFVIGFLILISIPLRGFWCRYLCPYGALLGLTSLLSPNKIKRNSESCIDCEKCTKACPSFIKVHKIKSVISDECTSCFNCIDSCPVKNTLQYGNSVTKFRFSKKTAAVIIAGIFIAVTGLGMLTGYWKNTINNTEYLEHQKYLQNYDHPKGIK